MDEGLIALPDDYRVCRGFVALLLNRGLRYPAVQLICRIDLRGQRPVYVLEGNALAKSVLSGILEGIVGRSFSLDQQWKLDADDALALVRIADYAWERAAWVVPLCASATGPLS